MKCTITVMTLLFVCAIFVGLASGGQNGPGMPQPLYAISYGEGTFVGGGDFTTSIQPLEITTRTTLLVLAKTGTGSGTVTSFPAGISCGGACSGSYDSGRSIILVGAADPGSYFAGWTSPCSGNSTCTVTMRSDVEIGATFNPAGFPFVDVPPGNWAEPFINAIHYAHVTTGYGGTNEFKPDYELTREQLAGLIVRAWTGEPPANYCDNGAPFNDVDPYSWSCRYIKRLSELGITTGYGGTDEYQPFLMVTRDQMAASIIRILEGEPPANYCDNGAPFNDVDPYSWSCRYIKRLSELGITTGYGGTRNFQPESTVTRAQMATFIGRAFLGMR